MPTRLVDADLQVLFAGQNEGTPQMDDTPQADDTPQTDGPPQENGTSQADGLARYLTRLKMAFSKMTSARRVLSYGALA